MHLQHSIGRKLSRCLPDLKIQQTTLHVVHFCSPQKLAEICHSGYLDALRFLRERGEFSSVTLHYLLHTRSRVRRLPDTDLLGTQLVPPSVEPQTGTVKPCCRQNPHQGDHRWLDPRVIENLPLNIQKGEDRWDLLSAAHRKTFD